MACDLGLDDPSPDDDPGLAGCVDYSGVLHLEGIAPSSPKYSRGSVYDLVISGRYCYAGQSGLIMVYDLSGPQLSSPVGSLLAPSRRMAISNNLLCTVDHHTIAIIDVSAPTRPAMVSTLDLPTRIHELTTDGNLVYLAAEEYGLWVVDIREPAHPRIIGSIDTPFNALDVAVINGTAFVADRNSLEVIDVRDPASPTRLASMRLTVESLELFGSYLIACNDRQLTVIDVSNPASPEILGGYVPPGFSVDQVVIDGRRAYLLGSDLVIADLTNLLSPRIVGRMPLSYRSEYCVGGYGGRVLLGASQGLLVIDASNPRSARPIGTANLQRSAEKVAAHGDVICVTAGGSVWLLDATSRNPEIVGRVTLETTAYDVAMDSTIAYIATSDGLVVVDADPKNAPRVIGRRTLPSIARGIAMEGDLAYVVGERMGLWIIDCANPQALKVVGSVYHPLAYGVALGHGMAFVATPEAGLLVVDVTNPRSPQVVSEAFFRGATSLCLQGDNLLHVAGESDSSAVYDISQPTKPRKIASIPIGRTLDVVADDRFAYFASMWGTQVVDMQDPTSPIFMGTAGQNSPRGLFLHESRLLVSGGNLEIMALQCDTSTNARNW